MLIDKKHLDVHEKVPTDAGSRNDITLLPHEIASSKVLLHDYEAALLELDREIAPLLARGAHIEEHLHTFRVAVAPHKRNPVELLNRIFAECEPDPLHVDDQPIPLDTRHPWVLGQADAPSRHLYDVLPPCASTTLEIKNSGSATSAAVIIPQVHNLDIQLKTVEFKSLFDHLPADIFENLETLHIYLTWTSRNQGVPMVLTEALSSAENPRSLTLGCDDKIIPQALSLDFPWRQIVSLDISGVDCLHVVAMSKYIQQFKSLQSPIIMLTDHADTIAESQVVVQAFQSIQLEAWARLVFLDLMAAKIADAATIEQLLHQCVQLVRFHSTVPGHAPSLDVRGRDIVLPHLTSLRLANIQASWIFQCLIVPWLKEMTHENLSTEENWNLDISTVHEMISSSGRSVHAWVETSVGDGFAKMVNVVIVRSNSVV
ncbi:hypothetical protein DXG03_004455 [Asterophora parasitica]|uniref:Uncharacterized protein n=1 Tax=Asterophora parasitica TaxID=117018 RepID=A0A9P7G2M9_9AGAR|nr:hypothetical protein DXG03_004455 [Asterophora parasitica]